MGVIVKARPLAAGAAEGTALVSNKPISFWGGLDPKTGRIIDLRHDRCGEMAAGRVFVFPAEKGSSTASAVLLELIRIGKAPAAIITRELAPILVLGAVVAQQLYGMTVPILQVAQEDVPKMKDGMRLRVCPDGTVECFAK